MPYTHVVVIPKEGLPLDSEYDITQAARQMELADSAPQLLSSLREVLDVLPADMPSTPEVERARELVSRLKFRVSLGE